MQPFAVFDLDGTLYNTHLGVELLKKLSDLGAIPGITQDHFLKLYQGWASSDDRTEFYNNYLDIFYNEHLRGVSQHQFNEACTLIADHALHHVYKFTDEKLRQHKASGHKIIIISKSPKPAVEAVAKRLQADFVWGWEFYFENGSYQGQYQYEDGEDNKKTVVETLVNQHGLILEGSYGYGDSVGDITVLQLVDNPTCINPDSKLLAVAKEKNWPIIYTDKTVSQLPSMHASVPGINS